MANDTWPTPWPLVRRIEEVLNVHFTLDVCASSSNAKAQNWFDTNADGLARDWRGTCWMNPPYSNPEPWCKKALNESFRFDVDAVVGLVPSSTDTRWWHQYVMKADRIYLLDRRVRFVGASNSAGFPCSVVVWAGGWNGYEHMPLLKVLNLRDEDRRGAG